MKYRQIILMMVVAGLLSSCSYKIYSVNERPRSATLGGVVFALPQTQINVDLYLTTYDRSSATYAQYAAEMVGAPENEDLKARAELTSKNIPDPRAYYYVVPRRIAVDITKEHLLRSVGLPSSDFSQYGAGVPRQAAPRPAVDASLGYNLYDRTDTFYVKGDKPGRPSMTSAKPDARPMRKRALDAAEQLRDVQERLQALERGEFEEGMTMEQIRFIQRQLREKESELLGLFVGKPETRKMSFTYVPKDEKTMIDSQRVVLFYYNPAQGVVDSGAKGAEPVWLEVRCDNQMRNAARFVKFRTSGRSGSKTKEQRCFRYRLAEQAQVEVSCKYFKTAAVLPIVQFGPVVTLPRRRFEALFDPTTGDLLYYNGRP